MPTFNGTPKTASKTLTPRVRVAKFGDGYEQRVGDGINRAARIWTLSWLKDTAIIAGYDTFLAARGGVEAFTWTDPEGYTGKFVCESWTRSPDETMDVSQMTATFREVFEA